MHYYQFWLPPFETPWKTWFQNYDYLFQFTLHIEPFLYGALGACIYLLKQSETFLQNREFDPSRIPEHWNRLVLGTLCGGAIILLITGIESDEGTFLEISAAALGFLAGYSVDFLFDTADRIIKAIMPKVGLTTVQLKKRTEETRDMIENYQDQLKIAQEKNDEQQIKLLTDIINDLKRV